MKKKKFLFIIYDDWEVAASKRILLEILIFIFWGTILYYYGDVKEEEFIGCFLFTYIFFRFAFLFVENDTRTVID